MKKLLLILLFVNSYIFAQDYVLFSSDDTLFGSVKSMKWITYSLVDEMGVYKKGDLKEELMEFNNKNVALYDKNGKKRYEFFELDGGKKYRHIEIKNDYTRRRDVTYDSSNNLILKEVFYGDSLARREINKYNTDNKKVSHKFYEGGELKENESYFFDDKGRLIEKDVNRYVNFSNNTSERYTNNYRYIYSLSSSGEKIIEIIHKVQTGETSKSTDYYKGNKIYKSVGRGVIENFLYDINGKLILEKSKAVETEDGYWDGRKKEYKFDNRGNKTSEILSYGGLMLNDISWIYDDNNRLYSETVVNFVIDSQDKSSKFAGYRYKEFKYDKYGNLIYEKRCNNNEQNNYCKKFNVEERIIEF